MEKKEFMSFVVVVVVVVIFRNVSVNLALNSVLISQINAKKPTLSNHHPPLANQV